MSLQVESNKGERRDYDQDTAFKNKQKTNKQTKKCLIQAKKRKPKGLLFTTYFGYPDLDFYASFWCKANSFVPLCLF